MTRNKDKIELLELRLKALGETAHSALATTEWLTNVLIEAGIIEDIDAPEVSYRVVKDYTEFWGSPYDRKQAYKVNSIEPKAKK